MDLGIDLSSYIRKKALAEGALLVGFTKIRRVEPVIVFGFPFEDNWFLKRPFKVARLLGKEYLVSRHVQDTVAKVLKVEGYGAHYKTVMSLYGDFRPLAVAAGLGQWGRNGIIVNKDHGAGLLFAALFTDAPLECQAEQAPVSEGHCRDCGQCISSCPAKAFSHNTFSAYRCLPYTMKGCAECLKMCNSRQEPSPT